MAANLGHPRIPTVAGPVDVQWSVDALEDLQRFADFLHERYPAIAGRVADELIARTQLLRRHPQIGRTVGKSPVYRELLLSVLGGMYAVQYRYDGEVVVGSTSATRPAASHACHERLLRLRDVLTILSLSRAHVYHLIKQGLFPRPIALGSNCARWVQSEVQAWLADRIVVARRRLVPHPPAAANPCGPRGQK